jgi:hypothetical protein
VEPSAEDQRKALKKSSTYPKIKRCLGAFGYEVVDYMSGTATTSGVKQPMKIGKILQGLEEQTLLDEFKVDSCRAWKELMIVVSRHPYDIVGMSTGREWKSCMTFDSGGDGCNRYYVRRDVLGGTLVAYLTSKKDKNLNNPMARLLIKKFEDTKGNHHYAPASVAYGLSNTFFRGSLRKIIESLNVTSPPSVYTFDADYFYDDRDQRTIDTRSEDIKNAQNIEMARRLDIKNMEMKKKLEAAFTDVESCGLTIPASAFQDILHFGKWKRIMGEIPQTVWDNFYNIRETLSTSGYGKRIYSEFIFNKINERCNTSDEVNTHYWMYISNTRTSAESWLWSLNKFADNGSHYHFLRLSELSLSYETEDLNDKLDDLLIPVYRNMSKIFEVGSPYRVCSMDVIESINDGGFHRIHGLNRGRRNMEYERTIIELGEMDNYREGTNLGNHLAHRYNDYHSAEICNDGDNQGSIITQMAGKYSRW